MVGALIPLFLGGPTIPSPSVCGLSCFPAQGTLACPSSPLKHAPQVQNQQKTRPVVNPDPCSGGNPLLCPPAALTSIWFMFLTPALCTHEHTSGSLLGCKVSLGMDFSYS